RPHEPEQGRLLRPPLPQLVRQLPGPDRAVHRYGVLDLSLAAVLPLYPERARRRRTHRRRGTPALPLEHRPTALGPGPRHGRPDHLFGVVERLPVAPHRYHPT